MMQEQRAPLTDEELLSIADDPEAVALLNSEERRRINRVRAEAKTAEPQRGILDSVVDFGREALASLNPSAINQGIQQAFWHPIETVKGIHGSIGQLQQKGMEAFGRGDVVQGTAEMVNSAIPFLGPRISESQELLRQGQTARGLGAAVDVGAQIAGPTALSKVGQMRVSPAMRPRNPVQQSAVAYGKSKDIPLTAGQATGKSTIQRAEQMAASNPGGAGIADDFRIRQADKMTQVGDELAQRAHPDAFTPETAGRAVHGSVEKLTGDFGDMQTQAYDRLRKIEADPQYAETTRTAPEGSASFNRLLEKLGKEGPKPSINELRVMRQIETELDAQPYQQGRLARDVDNPNADRYYRGHANASVYQDIQQAAGTEHLTGHQMIADIRQTLETGRWNPASLAAYQVAQKRVRSSGSLTGPNLAPETALLGKVETVALPVHLEQAKTALQPLYERLKRESELVPLMGDKGRALTALDRLMNGPDVASVSVVDAALGDLKALARADIPELRTQGQGVAAKAVQELHAAVDEAVQRAPGAADALEEGRSATRAKYDAGAVLEQMDAKEPVAVYRRAMAPKDAGIDFLRQLQEKAPAEVPKMARAYLDDLIQTATSEGGFGHTDKLFAEWTKLGPETKKILFSDPDHLTELNQYFQLAKQVGRVMNPSGTALSLNATKIAGMPLNYVLGKLFYSPAGVRLLSEGLRIPTRNRAAHAAWTAEVTRALGEMGPEAVPAAAEGQREGPRSSAQPPRR